VRTLDRSAEQDDRRSRRAGDRPAPVEEEPVSDVVHVVLTVALFAVLALALRGLEKL
jgi:hypothetical protein